MSPGAPVPGPLSELMLWTWWALAATAVGVALAWRARTQPEADGPARSALEGVGVLVVVGVVVGLAWPWVENPARLMGPDQLTSMPGDRDTLWAYWPRDQGRPSRLSAPLLWGVGQLGGVGGMRILHAVLAGVAAVAAWSAGRRLGVLGGPLLAGALWFDRFAVEALLLPRAYALPVTLGVIALAAGPRGAVGALLLAALDDPFCLVPLAGYLVGMAGAPGAGSLWLAGAAGSLGLARVALLASDEPRVAAPALSVLLESPVVAMVAALGVVAAAVGARQPAGPLRARAWAGASGAVALLALFSTGLLGVGPRYAMTSLPFLLWAMLAAWPPALEVRMPGGDVATAPPPWRCAMAAGGQIASALVFWVVWTGRAPLALGRGAWVVALALVAAAVVAVAAGWLGHPRLHRPLLAVPWSCGRCGTSMRRTAAPAPRSTTASTRWLRAGTSRFLGMRASWWRGARSGGWGDGRYRPSVWCCGAAAGRWASS